MESKFKGKHFLTCEDWKKEETQYSFKTSFELKTQFLNEEPHLPSSHKTLFMIFPSNSSTRTRNSMEAGMTQLWRSMHTI